MSDDLKPCPFCGGEPEWVDIPDDKFSNTGGSVIECMSCGASTHVEFGFKENLIDTWNRRANDDHIEELEANLAKAVEGLTQIERTYYQEAANPSPETIRRMSARMNGIARDTQDAIAELTGGKDE